MNQTPIDPIGVGIKYPLTFENGGLRLTAKTLVNVPGDAGIGDGAQTRLELVATQEEKRVVIKQSISRIVLTPRGSRFMRGQDGSAVREMLFETNEPVMQSMAAAYASIAVQLQEPRVSLLNASGEENADNPAAIDVNLQYYIQQLGVTDGVTVTAGQVYERTP